MSIQTMRAWEVSIPSWGDENPVALTMATTRGQAIHRNLCGSQDAGYGLKFTDFRATRRPEFDKAFRKHGMFSWGWDHAMARLADGSWRTEPDIAAMQARLEHANQLIEAISAHGRRFFWSETRQRTARLELRLGCCVFLIDDYTGKAICTHGDGRWDGFSHGGTLKALVEDMRDYIVDGHRIARWKIVIESRAHGLEENIWGYSLEAAQAVRAAAYALPIIQPPPPSWRTHMADTRPMRNASTWLAYVNEHRPSPAKGVTPWFSCSVRPARQGWYERQFTDGIYRQWWNGVAWLFGPGREQHWRQVDSYPCWRGLTRRHRRNAS